MKSFFSHLGMLLLGMATGALLVCYILAGDIYDYQDTVDGVHLPKVDAIVCLAGGRGRIAAAGDLWYHYWELAHSSAPGLKTRPEPVIEKIPILYMSGMGPQTTWTTFSKQLRRGIQQELKPENVILEIESENTEENALWLSRHARKLGWKKILLVTSSYHMKRARYMFDQVLKTVEYPMEIETLSVIQDPFGAGEWRAGGLHSVRVTVWEYFKALYYKTFWKPQARPRGEVKS